MEKYSCFAIAYIKIAANFENDLSTLDVLRFGGAFLYLTLRHSFTLHTEIVNVSF